MLRAFAKGMDGVLIGACRLNECNYLTQGNYQILNKVYLFKKIMTHLGLNPERLRLEFMSSGEGNLFAAVVDDFVGKVRGLGPLGKGEGLDERSLALKLKAIARLIPYIRLVESEQLRVKFATPEEYGQFYSGEAFSRLFDGLIAEKLAVSQIVLLLKESPLATAELSKYLGLTPSEISRHINSAAKQGLVRYEENSKLFALA
jgi:DNA-binding transcriptional ArsR family regulator